MVSELALFCLATYLATFQKNWAIFFQIIWSLWKEDKNLTYFVQEFVPRRRKGKIYNFDTRDQHFKTLNTRNKLDCLSQSNIYMQGRSPPLEWSSARGLVVVVSSHSNRLLVLPSSIRLV
jgi:hypothetical protein